MPDINYAGVRQVVYAITAGLLAAAAGMGWLTADETAALTDHVESIMAGIGALIVVLAGANTHPEREPTKRKQSEGLPVYDGPTSTPYVGKHRAS